MAIKSCLALVEYRIIFAGKQVYDAHMMGSHVLNTYHLAVIIVLPLQIHFKAFKSGANYSLVMQKSASDDRVVDGGMG